MTEDACRDLLARFAAVPDPRRPRGIRHQVQTILAVAAVAVVCGARSFAAIGEWAADAPQWVLSVLGARRHRLRGVLVAPHEATLRRTIQSFDAELLDGVISAWLAAQAPPSRADTEDAAPPAVAVDGKTVRGAWRVEGTQVHLLSAIGHHDGVVLAQREIAAKTNEIPELAPLLAEVDLTGVVVTADALHTQRETARHLFADRKAHYVFTVKGNQPSLFAACQRALSGPVSGFTAEHVRFDRGHGRTEQRTTRVAPVTAESSIDFPHAAQVFWVRRDVGGLDGQRVRKEIAYCITSLDAGQAGPDQLARYIRGHWTIENRLHWVRDVTYDEDRSQARTGSGPRVMASLRNLAISALRLHGHTNIASALRWTARDPARSLHILGIT
ncbi:MAG: ISAs1 family transposase [Nocardioidaceae bacterium]